jgi:hypothetical protein
MYQQQPSGLVGRRGIPTDGRGGGVRHNRIPKTIHHHHNRKREKGVVIVDVQLQ